MHREGVNMLPEELLLIEDTLETRGGGALPDPLVGLKQSTLATHSKTKYYITPSQ